MTTDTIAVIRESYLSAQLAGNRREALRLLVDEGILRGIPLPTLHLAREVREAAPVPRMAVGGLAFTWVPGVEAELGVPFFGKDARELVAAACGMFEVRHAVVGP